MTILEKLPDDLVSSLKTTKNQALLKRFSGKQLLKPAAQNKDDIPELIKALMSTNTTL